MGGCRRSGTPGGVAVAADGNDAEGLAGGLGRGGGVLPSTSAGAFGNGGAAASPGGSAVGPGVAASDCSLSSRSDAQLGAGFELMPPGANRLAAAGIGGGVGMSAGDGGFGAGAGMSNNRGGGVGAGGAAATGSDSDSPSASIGSSGATGVRSAGESSIPGSGTNDAVLAPSGDIHSFSALSIASGDALPWAGVMSGLAGAPSAASRKPSSERRPANSLMPSTVRSTP